MRIVYRAALAAIAAAAVAACHNDNNRATDSANGTLPSNGSPQGTAFSDSTHGAASANGSNATPAAAAPAATAPAESSAMSTGAMSDANILAKADVGDSAEVAIANYMAANTSNPRVRAFAILLRNDHSRGMSQIKSMQVPLQLSSNDTTAQETSHVLDHLKSLNGADRDTAFVNHEIEDHQHDIADAQQMAQSAQSPQVKSLVQNELPELKKHLDRAQQLANQMSSR